MAKKLLSVVLATRNEQENIGACLASVKKLADELIVLDENSSDKTRQIARKHGAIVHKVDHEPIFHKTKQIALDKATGTWILQLDADERVTSELAREVKKVINLSESEIAKRKPESKKKGQLFKRHQEILEQRDGRIGTKTGDVAAFFLPRLNFFLGKPLIHAGVYPDANIRLVKQGKARFPAKSVHEQMEVDGKVAWLFSDLEHHDSPTLKRYVERANRYTDLHAEELNQNNVPKNIFHLLLYTIYKPLSTFLNLYFRHLGFLDGIRGFIWSLFSAWHFPIAYFKYYSMK